jgi:hypothetical protein
VVPINSSLLTITYSSVITTQNIQSLSWPSSTICICIYIYTVKPRYSATLAYCSRNSMKRNSVSHHCSVAKQRQARNAEVCLDMLTVLSTQSVLLGMQTCTSICSWNILFAECTNNRLLTTWSRNFVARQSSSPRPPPPAPHSFLNCKDDFYSTPCPAGCLLPPFLRTVKTHFSFPCNSTSKCWLTVGNATLPHLWRGTLCPHSRELKTVLL